ncbi:Auxin efflux carrier [Corchorus capsularis]|uniref:Auxin efflux carrier n=1 Tax=Corchorus capsularis TaxID=210143 RepID=A0A1R3H5R5_COCAP|nr:Auxin efflux carrier [Corchorus capsularis]
MEVLPLFLTSLMSVLKVLLVIVVGVFLATERVDLFGPDARRHVNNLIFYVFFPALIGGSLAHSITIKDLAALWFIPVNISILCTLGLAFGWILAKITRTPRHLHGLVIGCSSTANLGNMLLIILPALCEEKSSPFAKSSTCSVLAKAYASLSLAIHATYSWSVVYFIMGMSAKHAIKEVNTNDSRIATTTSVSSNGSSLECSHQIDMPQTSNKGKEEIPTFKKVKQSLMVVARSKSLKMIFAPTTIAAIVGFIIGIAAPIRKILIGDNAPLRVVYSSAKLIGEAGVPCLTLIVGANLLKGLRGGSGASKSLIIGIIVIKNILLPGIGILIVKVAKYWGLVKSDSFYQFTLMLQYHMPDARKWSEFLVKRFLMELSRLFITSSIPVLKVLLVIAVGLLLATKRVDLLGADARNHLNNLIFYVFLPALIACSLANTITIEDLSALWFLPVNIFISCVIGSAFGWILVKITGTPKHLHGLVIACSSAANLGNMLLIILPALCEEKDSPFGHLSSCSAYGKAYASLSLAIQAIYVWSVLYSIMGISAKHAVKEINRDDSKITATTSPSSNDCSKDCLHEIDLPQTNNEGKEEISTFRKVKQSLMMVAGSKSLKKIFSPPTIAAIIGFIIGIASPIRKALIGDSAPLHVIYSSAELIGEAGLPSLTLIVGANLLKGLKGSGVSPSLVIGILVIKTILLPGSGILVVKVAKHWGLVNSDPFYQFTLLLQYAIPTAMNIGTISQMLGNGEIEFSVLMLWNYLVAPFSLALWTAFYIWLLT